jgi:hypothetical protein
MALRSNATTCFFSDEACPEAEGEKATAFCSADDSLPAISMKVRQLTGCPANDTFTRNTLCDRDS